MSDLPVRIRLIEKICRNYSAFSAEGLMYGLSVFLGMRFHDQLTYLSEEGYEDRKYFRSETNKARKIIMQADLDIDLIRYGSPMILPFFSEPIYPEPEDSSMYQSLLDLEEPVSFGDIAAKVISELDPARIDEILQTWSTAQETGIFVYDLNGQREFAYGSAYEGMYASAAITVPILYTAASLLDAGVLTLNDQIVYENSIGGRGEPFPENRDGIAYPLSYYLTTMLSYSDNNCMNCLIDLLTLERINAICHAAGFEQVDLQRKIVADVTDGTENYVSA